MRGGNRQGLRNRAGAGNNMGGAGQGLMGGAGQGLMGGAGQGLGGGAGNSGLGGRTQ
jgi:hypothetical protein